MGKTGRIFSSAIAVAAVALWVGSAGAYESYHDPTLEGEADEGYCSSCHPGFLGGRSDTTHALHTGNPDPVTGNCSLCHTGSGRDNPLIMWSAGDLLGCTGCHGRDYGETIQANYRGFPTQGKAKASGYGLRAHHAGAGVTVCADCHTDTVTPVAENVNPPYYARGDVRLGGAPVDSCSNEDSGNDADSTGLDNDGDDAYDGADKTSPGNVCEDCACNVGQSCLLCLSGGTCQETATCGCVVP